MRTDDIYTAILVDGAFYRKRSYKAYGEKSPKERAEELDSYCRKHLVEHGIRHNLYRIFYYDCPPMSKNLWHPYEKKIIDFSKTDIYTWANEFFEELKLKRKFAIRLGKLADKQAYYNLAPKVTKKLCNGTIKWEDLAENDFELNVDQKGVDMRIGLDIASLAYKKQVNQIVLISGDSDFVPAAKLARREGIDFILDPLGSVVKPDLLEHIDGLRTCDPIYKSSKQSSQSTNTD